MRVLIASAALALLAGCPPPEREGWTVLTDDLDGVLLGASGRTIEDVWVVGGPLGSAGEGIVLRRDGDGWGRMTTGSPETLWWVWAAGPDDAFAVGEGGTIVRAGAGAVTPMASPLDVVLFGVWGSSASDVWAVGGSPFDDGSDTDVILHYDGTEWTRAAVPDPRGIALFKVWGRSADDVWVVGQRGAILHYDGGRWSWVESPTEAALFTVHGNASGDVWAVGGPPATLLHLEGGRWVEVDPPAPASVFSGVHVGEAGDVLVVGWSGTKLYRTVDGTWLDEFDAPPEGDLHAAWMEGGHALAVGGNFNAPAGAMRAGILAYRGRRPPASP